MKIGDLNERAMPKAVASSAPASDVGGWGLGAGGWGLWGFGVLLLV